MSLSDKLKNQNLKSTLNKSNGPIWSGPGDESPSGGITFSMLSRWVQCRERFRLLVVEGLRPIDTFNHRISYGSAWHQCEEALARESDWHQALEDYRKELCSRYSAQQEQVHHWMNMVAVQFPHYVEFWSKHNDVQHRTPLLQEQVFSVGVSLPSGRRVNLRGKFDAVDLIGEREKGIWLFETKTKSEVNEVQIARQITRDLQTMLYLCALSRFRDPDKSIVPAKDFHLFLGHKKYPIYGVRYNVIKRPRQYQGKKETQEQFYLRLDGIIKDNPAEFFHRWTISITPTDLHNFQRQVLFPILEELCVWWDLVVKNKGKAPWGPHHWIHPFGVRNILDEGGSDSYDAFLEAGSMVGLNRVDALFTELV